MAFARERRLDLEIRCWPDDLTFRGEVRQAMEIQPDSPEALERQLRSRYPAVRVVAQDAAAAYVRRPVWYVYRDGRLLAH
jgi:hypothetical protein